jgi:hypothetical protein
MVNAGSDIIAEQAAPAGTTVQLHGAASDVCDTQLDYLWEEILDGGETIDLGPAADLSVTLNLGFHVLRLTAYDDSGNEGSDEVTVEIVDTQPPVIDQLSANPPLPAEQATRAGTEITLSGHAEDACAESHLFYSWYIGEERVGDEQTLVRVFPLGTTLVTFKAADHQGNTAGQNIVVTIVDTTPPTICSVSAAPNTLWPPNHKMVEVKVTVDTIDICDAAPICKIVDVTSNEPVNGLGDGDTEPDWEITGNLTVKLRAERAGNGTGRVYTLHIACTDASGNIATATVAVTVPRDQGNGKK